MSGGVGKGDNQATQSYVTEQASSVKGSTLAERKNANVKQKSFNDLFKHLPWLVNVSVQCNILEDHF